MVGRNLTRKILGIWSVLFWLGRKGKEIIIFSTICISFSRNSRKDGFPYKVLKVISCSRWWSSSSLYQKNNVDSFPYVRLSCFWTYWEMLFINLLACISVHSSEMNYSETRNLIGQYLCSVLHGKLKCLHAGFLICQPLKNFNMLS